MRRWRPAALLALTVLWPGGGRPEAQAPAGGDDEARAIVLEALERAAWYEEHDVAARYRARMTRKVRRFDGNGDVRTEDVGDYEVAPIDGVPFERRLTVGDRPLNDVERSRENEREAAFREELRRRRERDGEPEEDEDAIVFNAELVARYGLHARGPRAVPEPSELPDRVRAPPGPPPRTAAHRLRAQQGAGPRLDRSRHVRAGARGVRADRPGTALVGHARNNPAGPRTHSTAVPCSATSGRASSSRPIATCASSSGARAARSSAKWRDFELVDDMDEQRRRMPGRRPAARGSPAQRD